MRGLASGFARTPPPSEEARTSSSTRRIEAAPRPEERRAHRRAVAVDVVGSEAVRIAARIPRGEVPRLLLARHNLSVTALDTTDGFLLSFVDGRATVGEIVDALAESPERTMASLCRLERYGVIGF